MIGNAADSHGGGLNCNGVVTLDIRESVFEENVAGSIGGAIEFDSPAEMEVSGSTFLRNVAGDGGGAISVNSALAARVGTSVFSGNRALSGNGGAVALAHNPSLNLCVAAATQRISGIRGVRLCFPALLLEMRWWQCCSAALLSSSDRRSRPVRCWRRLPRSHGWRRHAHRDRLRLLLAGDPAERASPGRLRCRGAWWQRPPTFPPLAAWPPSRHHCPMRC